MRRNQRDHKQPTSEETCAPHIRTATRHLKLFRPPPKLQSARTTTRTTRTRIMTTTQIATNDNTRQLITTKTIRNRNNNQQPTRTTVPTNKTKQNQTSKQASERASKQESKRAREQASKTQILEPVVRFLLNSKKSCLTLIFNWRLAAHSKCFLSNCLLLSNQGEHI